jgi:predicted nuclease of predicted toxin-antitoxin system
MKILIDMNLAVRWANMLSAQGIEAIHWSSVGKANTSDDLIMAYAKENDYVILTKDLDFSAILAATYNDKPSIIQIRAVDSRPEKILDLVCLAINRFSVDIEKGAIVTLDMQKARIHILPFIAPAK